MALHNANPDQHLLEILGSDQHKFLIAKTFGAEISWNLLL